MNVIQILSHRGDGDWLPHYQAGHVNLAQLLEARDKPDSMVLQDAIGELAIPSANDKGKSRAADVPNLGAASSGQRPTSYTGVSVSPDCLHVLLTGVFRA